MYLKEEIKMSIKNFIQKPIVLVTHSSRFHADDVFATACLRIYYKDIEKKKIKLIRSRDEKVIEKGDVVYDVGNTYDPEKNRFDHHQTGGAGTRENGVPYSSFGLIWKHFGLCLVSNDEIHELIDEKFVQQICAADTAYSDFKIEGTEWNAWTFDDVVKLFRPERSNPEKSRKPEKSDRDFNKLIDRNFMKVVLIAEQILRKIIEKKEQQHIDTLELEEIYNNTKDKRIIELRRPMSWNKFLISKLEPLYVIFPTDGQNDTHIVAVPKEEGSHENRLPFPKEWGGKRNEELSEISGVSGAIFSHGSGFMSVAKNRDVALEMIEKSINWPRG